MDILMKRDLSRALLVWPVFFSCLAVGAYPAKITVDGYFYLSSGKALFTDNFSTHYLWIREPGYPVFLRGLQEMFGSSDVVLSFFQAWLLLSPISLLLFLLISNRGKIFSFLVPFVLLIAVATPQYMGYSGMVLKQPMLVANLVLCSVVVAYSYRRPTRRGFAAVASLIGLLTALSVAISLTQRYMWFATSIVCAVAWFRAGVRRPFRKIKIAQLQKGALACIILGSVCFLAGSVSLAWWDGVRSRNAPEEMQNSQVTVDETGRLALWLSDPGASFKEALDDFQALLMIGPTENSGGVKENELFSSIQAHPAWRCGAADEFTLEPYTAYGRSAISFSCRSEQLHGLANKIHGLGSLAYKMIMISGLFSFGLLALRRKLYRLLVLAPGMCFVIIYSASGSFVVDRYGLPFFPFALAAVATQGHDLFVRGVVGFKMNGQLTAVK